MTWWDMILALDDACFFCICVFYRSTCSRRVPVTQGVIRSTGRRAGYTAIMTRHSYFFGVGVLDFN